MVGPASFELLRELLPRHGLLARGQRSELGHRPATDGHSQTFTGFDTAQDCAHIVAEVACRNVGHPNSVARLLQKVCGAAPGDLVGRGPGCEQRALGNLDGGTARPHRTHRAVVVEDAPHSRASRARSAREVGVVGEQARAPGRDPVEVLDDRRGLRQHEATVEVLEQRHPGDRPQLRELGAARVSLDERGLELEAELVKGDQRLPAERGERCSYRTRRGVLMGLLGSRVLV